MLLVKRSTITILSLYIQYFYFYTVNNVSNQKQPIKSKNYVQHCLMNIIDLRYWNYITLDHICEDPLHGRIPVKGQSLRLTDDTVIGR